MQQIDGINYADCIVVMKPTEDKQSNLLLCIKSYEEYGRVSKKGNLSLGVGMYSNDNLYSKQHLYILSNEKIREGDWVMNTHTGAVWCVTKIDAISIEKMKATMTKQIVATNDKSISDTLNHVAQIDVKFIEYFIQEYNAKNIIKSVLVEYEYRDIATWSKNEDDSYECLDCHKDNLDTSEECDCWLWYAVVNHDNNTISLLYPKEEKMYTRTQVLELVHKAWMRGGLQYQNTTREQTYSQFIEENL